MRSVLLAIVFGLVSVLSLVAQSGRVLTAGTEVRVRTEGDHRAPGTKIIWTNRDETPHTVTSTDKAFASKENFEFTSMIMNNLVPRR